MKIELSPDEVGYVLRLLKEPLEYYRLLSGNPQATRATKERRAMLEALMWKLAR